MVDTTDKKIDLIGFIVGFRCGGNSQGFTRVDPYILLVKKLSRGLIAVLEVHLDIEGTTLIRGNSGQEFLPDAIARNRPIGIPVIASDIDTEHTGNGRLRNGLGYLVSLTTDQRYRDAGF